MVSLEKKGCCLLIVSIIHLSLCQRVQIRNTTVYGAWWRRKKSILSCITMFNQTVGSVNVWAKGWHINLLSCLEREYVYCPWYGAAWFSEDHLKCLIDKKKQKYIYISFQLQFLCISTFKLIFVIRYIKVYWN